MFIFKKNQETEEEEGYKNNVNGFLMSSLLSGASKETAKEILELLDMESDSEDSDEEDAE
jgi:hypothetical protein